MWRGSMTGLTIIYDAERARQIRRAARLCLPSSFGPREMPVPYRIFPPGPRCDGSVWQVVLGHSRTEHLLESTSSGAASNAK